MHKALIEWQGTVHKSKKNSTDWYWSIGIIITTIAIISFLMNSVIFGIFIIVSGVTLVLLSKSETQVSTFSINDTGIIIDDVLYPFVSLDSFWITNDPFEPKLLVKSRKMMVPLLIMPIEGVHPADVKQVMQIYIAEQEIAEPFGRKFLDLIGF